MKLSKTELDAKSMLDDGYTLQYDWVAQKWSLQMLMRNGMLLHNRILPATAANIIKKLELTKLPYDGGQRDRYRQIQ